MKNLFLLIIILPAFQSLMAQYNTQVNLDTIMPPAQYDNAANKMIYSDSSVTTFIIWVKTSVPLHKHAWHTEQVTVLEGAAEMMIGDKTISIAKGDIIFIPENTPHSVRVTSAVPLKVLSVQAPEFKGDDRIMLNN